MPGIRLREDGTERSVREIALQLSRLSSIKQAGIFHLSWWSDRVLDWAMSHDEFKTRLFRLVDTYPSLGNNNDLVADYLEQYFSGIDIPPLIELGLAFTDHVPGGHRLSSAVTRHNIERIARQFISGSNATQAGETVRSLWRNGIASTVDLLGEHTCSQSEADAYAARLSSTIVDLVASTADLQPDDHLERDDTGPIPPLSVSVKCSALTPHFYPLAIDRAVPDIATRLLPILKLAIASNFSVFLDMEAYETKEIIHTVFEEVATNPLLQDLHLGIVVQAYCKDALRDLEWVAKLSDQRSLPLWVRLVKGAYWDTESAISLNNGWPNCVFDTKLSTDANFELCTDWLHSRHQTLRAAFATHNIRSISYAIARAKQLGISDNGYEIQLLYGMAEPLRQALSAYGTRTRIYAPIGELIPGMAYLVRRLLENTSNEGFVRQRFVEKRDLIALLKQPHFESTGSISRADPRLEPKTAGADKYSPEPPMQWRAHSMRQAMQSEVDDMPSSFPIRIPILIGGEEITPSEMADSLDPANPSAVVANYPITTVELIDQAVSSARAGWISWRDTSASERAAILRRAAGWMRQRRTQLAALQVFEVGKCWADADADVCEAIDYCEYYSHECLRLDDGATVASTIGEENRYIYRPKGVGVVITPWNFPLAIPTGMVTAALATGNTVIFKPAEQAPACGYMLIQALKAAGLPSDAICFLPGPGEIIGPSLVSHPDIDFISFTGSREVGLSINSLAAQNVLGQKSVKKVVSEMGGKNAIVVDNDADLDEAVIAIIKSAFSYSGQKCSAASRIIAVGTIYQRLVERLIGATGSLRAAHPRFMDSDIGPLIDQSAVERFRRYSEIARSTCKILYEHPGMPGPGYFVPPTIVGNVDPTSPIATNEIFAPILAVFQAKDLPEAFELVNESDYALTAGIFSRSPRNIAMAQRCLFAGNLYINRSITGAVVGRQPFGGNRLSGVGSKAGGPDYLVQFTNPIVISENTMRHGYAPSDGLARPDHGNKRQR